MQCVNSTKSQKSYTAYPDSTPSLERSCHSPFACVAIGSVFTSPWSFWPSCLFLLPRLSYPPLGCFPADIYSWIRPGLLQMLWHTLMDIRGLRPYLKLRGCHRIHRFSMLSLTRPRNLSLRLNGKISLPITYLSLLYFCGLASWNTPGGSLCHALDWKYFATSEAYHYSLQSTCLLSCLPFISYFILPYN